MQILNDTRNRINHPQKPQNPDQLEQPEGHLKKKKKKKKKEGKENRGITMDAMEYTPPIYFHKLWTQCI